MPNPNIIKKAREIYKNDNLLKIMHDPKTAVQGANVLYTDVWSSMGEENQKERRESLSWITINNDLVNIANKDAIILHCLPGIGLKK